ncbi:MAG: imidazole glycerol phosphate synthase subunit HisF [Rhodocyclales bacterium]|nr:imidazole glycerol phosphate synthase subunit HisF [Rhodocyclales bacterium]
MRNVRVIARLDIKGANLIKGINLEGLRVVGDPREFAERYYREGADELLYVDAVASLYGRNSLIDLVRATADKLFVPLTVGGGIRSVDDVTALLRAGADKVAVNTAAVKNPALISEIARRFGRQCMVLYIEAKASGSGRWEAYTDGGREHSGLDAVEWGIRGAELGAGEILLTSVDREGTGKGFDIELGRAVAGAVDIPVILSGGAGSAGDIVQAVDAGAADAVAVARVLHYGQASLQSIRALLSGAGYYARPI